MGRSLEQMGAAMSSFDTFPPDDLVANFQMDQKPVRGRIARLGNNSLAPIIDRHKYPVELARLVGEAVTLAALIGSSIKFDGRLLVQAEGAGAVTMLVGEYSTETGGLRGYARYDKAAWEKLERINKGGRPHMPQLFGSGALGIIIVHSDPSMRPYQGVVPLAKATLAECAEDYFNQSEQVPTRVALSVAEHKMAGEDARWRSGGMLLQQVAGDDARGDTDADWEEARALFATLTDEELADPQLAATDLLYRLFHEGGVRMEQATALIDMCTCSQERLESTLKSMPDDQLREMAEPDGTLVADCQFCSRVYRIPLSEITEPAN